MTVILLIEDSFDLASSFIDYLSLHNINVDYAPNAELALNLMQENKYSCILLDISLPGIDGYQFCRQIRMKGEDISVLMITAKDQLKDKLEGFKAGADDFLVKPVALEELLARIKVLCNRKSGQTMSLQFSNLVMDLGAHICTVDGQALILTPTGWKILEILLRRAPEAVSRTEMESWLWGDDIPNSDSLKVHLHKLRHTLEELKNSTIQLKTISCYGFKLICSPEE